MSWGTVIPLLAGLGGLAHLLARRLGLRPRPWAFGDARSASLWGGAAILAGWLLVSLLLASAASSRSGPPAGPAGPPAEVAAPSARQAPSAYGLTAVGTQALLAALAFGPAVLALRIRREPWASAGVTRAGLGRAAALGLVLSALIVGLEVATGGADAGRGATNSDRAGALCLFAIVGFGEEFAFRGYLQGRLVAWLGRWPGWLAASVLMALAHFTQRVAVQGLAPLPALADAASLIPVSLFSGYVMLCTGNIVAPALIHTAMDWAATL